MTTKSKKHILGFTIFTTSELDEKIYITSEIEIMGSFVKFKPQIEIGKKSETKLQGSEFTLPERVIKEIIYQEIDESILKTKK